MSDVSKKEKGWRRFIYPSPGLIVILALSTFWSISMFVAPAVLEPGTVIGLEEGTSNEVNYNDLWETLDPYTRAVYTFGDSQCHQKESRSFIINGNQMPTCSRVFSIFFFANMGLLVVLFIRPELKVSRMILFFLPKRFKEKHRKGMMLPFLTFLFITLMTLPVAIDGFYQLLTPYESTNTIRVLTGLSMGFMGGIVMGSLLSSVWVGVKTAPVYPQKGDA